MKKLIVLIGLILMCTACSTKVVKNAAVYQQEESNIHITLRFDAKGDEIVGYRQTTTIDIEGYSQEQLDSIKALTKEAETSFKHYQGAKYKVKLTDKQLVENISVPINKKNLKINQKYNILSIQGNDQSGLSLERTKKALKESGWEKVK